MQKRNSTLVFSPHDLVAFLQGDFVSWMDRFHLERRTGGLPAGVKLVLSLDVPGINPDESDEEQELIKRKGLEHESRLLTEFRQSYPDMVEFEQSAEAAAGTVEAMRKGPAAIYQGCLTNGEWLGYPDFLLRLEGASKLGGHHYEPWDAKLANSAKPHFIVQLCAYAEMLEEIQGRRPAALAFLLGGGNKERFKTNDYFHYYRRLKRSFLEFQARFDPKTPPDPGLEREFGRWETVAEAIFERSDHLSRVARITRMQIRRLEEAGIQTMTALAETKVAAVAKMQPEILARLKEQACLQIASRGLEKPKYAVVAPDPEDGRRGLALLPAPSKQDVFFDMEGFPLIQGGLEYLFGAVHVEGGKEGFADWWAHDDDEERRAFEGFVDWAYARWNRDPDMHIYHYAAYEKTALRRLMGKYATREQEVDDFLRNEVLVDLYTVVRQGVRVGTPSYSLKDIERLFMPKRAGEVKTAAGSVVAYQRWLDSGEPHEWKDSPILKEIREYNRTDCVSLVRLRDWLLGLQKETGIAYVSKAKTAEDDKAADKREPPPAAVLAQELLAQVEGCKKEDRSQKENIQELLAWLLEFHRREAKPVWWRMFDRHEMTEQELIEDFDCLGGLARTKSPKRQVKRSWAYEYRFDPDQDTKMDVESKCYLAHDLTVKTTIEALDREKGLVSIKLGPSAPVPPERLGLIPDEFVSADVIAGAIYRYVEAWANGKKPSQAVDDLLCRRRPRIAGHNDGPIIRSGDEIVQRTCDVVSGMQGTTLCIQGPPGTGKTYVSGAVIAKLLKVGKRIGVTANSHKAILNVMHAVVEHLGRDKTKARLLKVGKDAEDPLVEAGIVRTIESKDVGDEIGDGPVLVGGTAWAFSRPELEQKFDYLFVDEAGQFSLANAVAVGLATGNLVLVGDQMQLSQPTQGVHPGESGKSGLEYLLGEHATIPADMGIFLDKTRRMNPDVCRFVSDAVYDGRLEPHPETASHQVTCPKNAGLIARRSGIVFVPVDHEGNAQCSEEEVEVIEGIVKGLLGREFVGKKGQQGRLGLEHILFVAPFNMQVRRLKARLGDSAHVGSVDKFQGLEAPVVIVSMCSSSLEDSPRGATFLLNPNRINVAVSRAQSLAIVVGSPGILSARCQTLEEMKLVNLFCRLVDYSEAHASGRRP